MKILITGSSGTIGTRLFETLLPQHQVTGVDIRSNQWHAALNGLTIRADLRNRDEFSKIPADFDMVIHLAANARVYELVKAPLLALDNMVMSFNVLDFMRENKIKKVIFASSRETYGNIMEEASIPEDRVRLENCESPYSASKISTEALIHAYRRVYGMDFIIIRFSNVYGMYDDSDRVIPLWMKQTLNGEGLTVFGGKKTLDFTYIDDTIDGIVKIITKFESVKGKTLNIAYGKSTKLLTVAEIIRKLLAVPNSITVKDNRPGEVWKFQADISRARELLGFQPKVGIEEGLKMAAKWYQDFYATK
jgi:UDP-glucose 4-epimerase